MDNKVVQTLARAAFVLGWRACASTSAASALRGIGTRAAARSTTRWRCPRDAPRRRAAGCWRASRSALTSRRRPRRWMPMRSRVAAGAGGPGDQKQRMPAVPPIPLVIHGEADDVVRSPPRSSGRGPRPAGDRVPGAGHFFHGQLGLLKNVAAGLARLPRPRFFLRHRCRLIPPGRLAGLAAGLPGRAQIPQPPDRLPPELPAAGRRPATRCWPSARPTRRPTRRR